MSALIIIPARYESSRFPGKPLAKIAGKSMIQRVFEQCVQTEADVIVATDDQRIFDHVISFDGNVCMTSAHHLNGTERIIEAFERILDDGEEYDVVINVQGDEPLIDPEDITRLINMMEEEETDIGTLVRQMDSVEDVNNPNIVKAVTTVFDEGLGDALYFSRLPIPYNRDAPNDIDPADYYQHIGLYGFQSEALLALKNSTPSPLEESEKCEQLRWLQNHFVVSVIETENRSIGVDSPEDISTVENILKRS